MKIIGKTTEDVNVAGDLFKMFDTTGLPLSDIFTMCRQNNIQPCWTDFYNQAINAGWKHKTTITRLHESICDVYGPAYRDVVISRLNLLRA